WRTTARPTASAWPLPVAPARAGARSSCAIRSSSCSTLGWPTGCGLELLDRLRSADRIASRVDPGLPVIVVSGRASEVDRVRGLARGADDYLAKPFSYPELVARIRAVLRRADGRRAHGALRVGELAIDPVTRSVSLAGEPVQLSNKEFTLLQKLASEPT